MLKKANLIKDFFIVTSMISMVLYLGLFGILLRRYIFHTISSIYGPFSTW